MTEPSTLPLLRHLEQTGKLGLLRDDERRMLHEPSLCSCSPHEQWAWLGGQRKWARVAAFNVGLRLFFLTSGTASGVVLIGRRGLETPDAAHGILTLACLLVFGWSLTLWPAFWRQLKHVSKRLPAFEDLGIGAGPAWGGDAQGSDATSSLP